ncbi:hypothetical protein BC827DRAFT_1238191 [Russula dissimulans]|nr:hypothetical protein BC827DRAFT_1238191 [Russula dissimulans]
MHTRAHATAPHSGAVRRVNLVWLATRQHRQPTGRHAFQVPDGLTLLDTLGQTLYLLFCVGMHEPAWWAAGDGVGWRHPWSTSASGCAWMGRRLCYY